MSESMRDVSEWLEYGGWDLQAAPDARETIIRAVNNHERLLEACKCFLRTWEKAGPLGSHQFEKFDTAVRLAEMAIAAAEASE